MNESREKRCDAASRIVLGVARVLRRVPLPFDLKFLLLLLVDLVVTAVPGLWNWKPGRDGTKAETEPRSIPNPSPNPRSSDSSSQAATTENPGKKVAVVLDGESPGGAALRDRLVGLGFYPVFPSRQTQTDKRFAAVRSNLDREESTESFIKKVSQEYKRIDLLVVNLQMYKKNTRVPACIDGLEKKIVPSKRKKGFITKNSAYRNSDRMLLEKDPNARRNYLIGFYAIRELEPALRSGGGRVLIGTSRAFLLAPDELEQPMIPSAFFSFCFSQRCGLFLGVGARTRYPVLDVQVVGTGLIFSGAGLGIRRWLPRSLSDPDRAYVEPMISALRSPSSASVTYFDGGVRQNIKAYVGEYDRANDLWEQAEVIS